MHICIFIWTVGWYGDSSTTTCYYSTRCTAWRHIFCGTHFRCCRHYEALFSLLTKWSAKWAPGELNTYIPVQYTSSYGLLVCVCGQVISEMCSGFFRICIICWFCCFTRTWLGFSAALVCPFLCQPKDLCRRTKTTGVYVWDLHELHELLQCPSEMGTPTITPCQQWKPGFVSLYLPRFKRHIKFMRVAFTSLYLCLTGRCFMGATVLGGRAEKTQIIRQPRRRHFVGSPVSYVFF